jgi:hypothetical protein
MLGMAVLAGFLVLSSTLSERVPFEMRRVDAEVVSTLRQAWRLVEEGRSSREAGVMVSRETDGRYTAKLVFDPETFHQVRFTVTPDVVAILHTHPNQVGREPSPNDRANSDLLKIPTFTMTNRGLWVYNPKTRTVFQVMLMTSWLDPKSWASEKSATQAGLLWETPSFSQVSD